ncbi:hypothetical protein QTO34_015156 [Cnephaeus nilssonii]|uniref:Uncharacterized protein n=1 Tax=Cnephaeus nilssonii TaxID=3371016 RepID=A0AA40LQF6_CNENI|nr:hypothetical protein QTO34_015156 [Eptesicus nilssonii]
MREWRGLGQLNVWLPFSFRRKTKPPDYTYSSSGVKEGNKGTRCCQQTATGDTAHSVLVKIISVELNTIFSWRKNSLEIKTKEVFRRKARGERAKIGDLRGTPIKIIDDNHTILSTSVGSEHYVNILPFVDKDLLKPGCSVLFNHQCLP